MLSSLRAFVPGILLAFVAAGPVAAAPADSVVARHGRLKVVGNHVVDRDGRTLSLAGNSFFCTNTGWEGMKFYNRDVVAWLKHDWSTTIVRAALGVEEAHGYLAEPEANQARLETLVDAAIAEGLYVIIDFHSFEAHRHQAQAITFFQAMARKYAKADNVIYEIYNEPVKVEWASTIKPYAEAVVAAIRAIDPDHLIIVGTPTWSQDVDVAARDPLAGSNLAYAVHFYAGTHKQWLRDKCTAAMQHGAALFISEWGSVNSDGNGPVAEAETEAWLQFARDNGLSLCAWAVNDKQESASIVRPGANPRGHWTGVDLTPSGELLRRTLRAWPKS